MDKDGFVLFKDYLSEHDGERVTRWGDEIESWREMKGKWMIYYEENGDEHINMKSRIENFIHYHPELEEFVKHTLQPLLEITIGEKVTIFKDKMNWKQGGGKGFAPHQDHPAWTDFPPSVFYTIAIFVDDATPENGCLEFVKGHGEKVVLPYDKEGNGGLLDSDKYEWNTVPTTSRDVLIFSSFAPHRSGVNKTDKSRRIFYFTFIPAKYGEYYDDYVEKKRELFPPPNEREEGKIYKTSGSKYNLANPIM